MDGNKNKTYQIALRRIVMKIKLASAAIVVLALQGCATPHVVETKKVSDNQLTCDEIVAQIEEADRFEAEARGERKVTGKNVAAALLFWPALIGTYANTEEAIDAARERKLNLNALYEKKKCS
jgi:hypothetical protein